MQLRPLHLADCSTKGPCYSLDVARRSFSQTMPLGVVGDALVECHGHQVSNSALSGSLVEYGRLERHNIPWTSCSSDMHDVNCHRLALGACVMRMGGWLCPLRPPGRNTHSRARAPLRIPLRPVVSWRSLRPKPVTQASAPCVVRNVTWPRGRLAAAEKAPAVWSSPGSSCPRNSAPAPSEEGLAL